ncbi:hypothetical protein B0J13DRAFT_154808 [Dactylonectria estremocensis]|uniref:Uncharacterized protein n=1 Tax=Dactylonectria estremocensis TaxID=1079267 RepID=A0A9P9DQK2_9HYPO|nr:hypothetical protein B0J13DRAFT_154808 [Dactylonectria estremocensis]
MTDSQDADSAIKCHICQSVFARQEHLTRHIRRHTHEKPYKCLECGKCFSRLDVLHRHTSSHVQDALEPRDTSARACKECATSRVRCAKGMPCKRCHNKGLTCTYPAARKRKAPLSDQGDASNRHTTVMNDTSPTAQMDRGETHHVGMIDDNTDGLHTISHRPAIQTPDVNKMSDELQRDIASSSCAIDNLTSFAQEPAFGGEVLGMSTVNWLSPQYQNILNWDSQLVSMSYGGEPADMEFYFPFNAITPAQGSLQPDISGDTQPLDLATLFSPQTLRSSLVEEDQTVASPGTNSPRSLSPQLTEGRLYVDGNAARAPFRGLLSHRGAITSAISSKGGTFEYTLSQFGAVIGPNPEGSDAPLGEVVSDYAYQNMLQKISSDTQTRSLGSNWTEIPPLVEIRGFVRQYFENFHPTYPFLRRSPSLFDQPDSWVLLLAVSAVGAGYSRQSSAITSKGKMLQLLKDHAIFRIQGPVYGGELWMPTGLEPTTDGHDLLNLQAGILALVCLAHSGDSNMVKWAIENRHYFVQQYKAEPLLPECESRNNPVAQGSRWMITESQSRSRMMLWLVDSVFVLEFNCSPLLQLSDATFPLPCSNKMWDHANVEKICEEERHEDAMTLLEATEILFMEKRLPPKLGNFSHILLIYAIIRRTKEVLHQNQTHLSNWTPNAKVQSRAAAQHISETWPPSLPIISKWRNSACDCLDILHWNANETATGAGGWEHPTILHLHLSRLLLLTPVKHMQYVAAASSPIATIRAQNDARYKEACGHLRQWAICDQFKARLSMVHAGAILWHVRRYSSDDFLEPFAIYLATLAIWAYSVSTQSIRGRQELDTAEASSGPTSSETNPGRQTQKDSDANAKSDEEPDPAFVHLDRPCDDEMVQIYVRLGHKISGYMLRVGDICSPAAPRKILKEGVRMLSRGSLSILSGVSGEKSEVTSTWGIGESYKQTLRYLIQATESQS